MATKLLNLAPTLLTLSLVAWVLWPYLPFAEPETPPAAAKEQTADKAKVKSRAAQGLTNPFEGVLAMLAATNQPRQLRRSPMKSGAGNATMPRATGGLVKEEAPEPIADMVLNATIIRGKKQIAMIDGRIYAKGDTIRGPDETPTNMRIVLIEPSKVLIARGRKRLELSYSNSLKSKKPPEELPDELASGTDPDVSAAISNNMGAELGVLRSILASPLGSSLLNLAGGDQGSGGPLLNAVGANRKKRGARATGSGGNP